jgi:hypothetical protein
MRLDMHAQVVARDFPDFDTASYKPVPSQGQILVPLFQPILGSQQYCSS